MANYPTFRRKKFYDKKETLKDLDPDNLFDSINDEESEEDGFLYIIYSSENTFG